MKGAGKVLSSVEERRNEICRHLAIAHFLSVGELARRVGFSIATVKRDLAGLEQQGFVRREHGGAVLVEQAKLDVPYFMKMARTSEERDKDALAGVVQHLIHDDMTLILDSSTTCLHVIQQLTKFKGLHIITNGVATAALLAERMNAEVCILGGVVSTHHQTVNGAKAYNDMLSYNADLAILSCRGFDARVGATEISEGEAILKQAMRRQAAEVALLATAEKNRKRFVYQSLSCSDLNCLVTDADLSPEDLSLLESSGIDLLQPGA